jgi:hypothetical protein
MSFSMRMLFDAGAPTLLPLAAAPLFWIVNFL